MDGSEENRSGGFLRKIEWSFGGIILGIFVFLLFFFILNYFNIVSLSGLYPNQLGWLPHVGQQISPTPKVPFSAVPTPTPETNLLESCDVKKQENALVDKVGTITVKNQTITVGNFKGIINKVTMEPTKTSALVEVVSPKGEQSHVFRLVEEDGLVYDMTVGKNKNIADFAAGQVVIISFDCQPDKEGTKKFRITRVAIVGKL